jgi:hypothetical protein
MSTITTSPSMPMHAITVDRNLLVTLAVALVGLALTAAMLPLFDAETVTALSMLG